MLVLSSLRSAPLFVCNGCCLFFALATLIGCKAEKKQPAQPPMEERVPSSADAGLPPLEPADQPIADALVKLGAKVNFRADRVAEVNLRGTPVTDEIAMQLSSLSDVKRLDFDETELSDDGWATLGKLSSVEHLDLRGCKVGNSQLTAAVSGMPRLKSLRLNGQSGKTTVDDEGLAVLAQCPDLKLLAADYLWVGGEGLQHIATPSNIVELYLAKTLVDDEAVAMLSSFTSLKKLRLAQTGVSSDGLSPLVALALEDLDVSECSRLDDSAMEHIGKLKGLARLNLWRDSITDAGALQLRELTGLKWLNLDNTQITDAGLDALVNMRQLEFLHLGSTLVTDAGMLKLAGLKSLQDLKVTRTAVTTDGIAVVANAIPGVDVQLKYIEGQ